MGGYWKEEGIFNENKFGIDLYTLNAFSFIIYTFIFFITLVIAKDLVREKNPFNIYTHIYIYI